MDEKMEKYVAAALEGYENNYAACLTALEQMRSQRDQIDEAIQQAEEAEEEMSLGIAEMKELLGLEDEEEGGSTLKLVTEDSDEEE